MASALPTPPSPASDSASLASSASSKCIEWRQQALLKSPMVRFMVDAMGKAGCPLSASDIQCCSCNGSVGGGFDPATRRVVLCENRLQGASHTETTLVHELVHAFDDCRANVDWSNCIHHACSEIRAANLSGDCSFLQEMMRGQASVVDFKAKGDACVRRRAELSVSMNPACIGKEKEAVAAAWASCFPDTEPFFRTP
jgi:mitochondrial inner membrane protease ATP23